MRVPTGIQTFFVPPDW